MENNYISGKVIKNPKKKSLRRTKTKTIQLSLLIAIISFVVNFIKLFTNLPEI